MSLNIKLFLSFGVMVVLAVATGLIGWSAADNLSGSLERVIQADLPLNDHLGNVARELNGIRAIQQSFFNVNLGMERRKELRDVYAVDKKIILDDAETVSGIFRDFETVIPGWNTLSGKWKECDQKLRQWLQGNDKVFDLFTEWEKTAIIDPNKLIGNLQQYRGDHYALATRLGMMAAFGIDNGGDITSSDTQCAFGRWRVSFDEGKELFRSNPVFVDAMRSMIEPHRGFHQTAHDIQQLVREDAQGNRERVRNLYQENVQDAQDVIARFQAMVDEANRASSIYNQALDYAMGDLFRLQEECFQSLDTLLDENGRNLDRNSSALLAEGRRDVDAIRLLTIGALVVGCGLALFIRWTIKKSLTGPLTAIIADLSREADQLTDAAGQFSFTSQALRQGVNQQESALEETGAALEQIASMSNKSLKNVTTASSLMSDTSRQVKEGSEAVVNMGKAMSEINDSSEQISRIIKTIEEIAFQTNLLALNAAVEAARAGEAGKGFAVVAEEVRNLAQRSAQASRDTTTLIEGTVQRIKNGSVITQEIEERFIHIAEATAKIEQTVSEIDTSSREQAQGIEQVNSAIAEIGEVTQGNSRNADESTNACTGLNTQVGSIREAVGKLGEVIGYGGNMRNSSKASGKGRALAALPGPGADNG